jgi:hypothetical protein
MLKLFLSLVAPFREYLFTLGTNLVAKVKWKQKETLTPEEAAKVYELLKSDYYIIATRRDNMLSCFFINLGHLLYTGRWGYYTHVLMNLEDEVNSPADFRLIEAQTKGGTTYVDFEHILSDVDGLALLKPKGLTVEDWTKALDAAKTQLGKPYDTLFDIANDQQLSCVELVRNALMAVPNYWQRFSHFENYIAQKRNLTPHMFIESPDFEVVWEIRR